MDKDASLVIGLQPVDKDLYKGSNKVTYQNRMLANKGDNMERFIVGRQFLVVLMITVINLCDASVKGAQVLGLSLPLCLASSRPKLRPPIACSTS